jgi:tetratricopeptide (TPR) repeat protein
VEIDLKKAVSGIKAPILETRERNSTDYPFFLIFGAGVSYPSIPLADGIVERCREQLQKLGADLPPETSNPLERYESHFQAAYQHKKSRQEFLSSLIRTKPIPAATFRLAHLLGTGKLTNLIFTPNFDELLSRALRLLGSDDFVICDHPKTSQRINPNARELQLIHVHGTHWFYDCCNLRHEIKNRSTGAPDGESMRDRLDEVLRTRSPIVVGYAGWEDDVIMQALKQRIEGKDLPYNLYWFCYKRAEAQRLPKWLTEHDDVRLVVPTGSTAPPQTEDVSAAGTSRKAPPSSPSLEGGQAPEPVLPAFQVFDALIEAFHLDRPSLTANPLGFFADQLERSLNLGDAGTGPDPYALRDVLRRVRASVNFVQEQTDALEQVRDAMRTAAYAEATNAARGINLEVLSTRESEELESILEQVYLAVSDPDPVIGLNVCRIRSEVSEKFLTLDEANPDWALRAAKALHGQGYCLGQLGQHQESLTIYERIIERFQHSQDRDLLDRVARAHVNRGIALSMLDRSEEAIAALRRAIEIEGDLPQTWNLLGFFLSQKAGVEKDPQIARELRLEAIAAYDEVIRRFEGSPDPAMRDQVAKALFNKGATLEKDGQGPAGVAMYDDIVHRFGEALEPALRAAVAKALFYKGLALEKIGPSEAEIAAYDEVVRRFGDAPEPALREQVAFALFNKALALGQAGKSQEAVAAYDDLVRRFGNAPELTLREQVAWALFNKGVVFGQTGASPEAIAAYDAVVQLFGDSPEPLLREHVARALVNKGAALGQAGAQPDAIAAYDEVVRRFGEAPEPHLREQVAWALFNRGVAQAQTGASPDAIASYDEVIRRFGESPEPALLEQVARAFVNRGVALGQTGANAEAIASYDEVIHRFGQSREPALREQVVLAFINKANALDRSGSIDEAIRAYEEAVFLNPNNPDLWGNLTAVLLAKGHREDKPETWAEALDAARHAATLGGNRYNLACALVLSGAVDEALQELKGCLDRGDISREHVAQDQDWDGLREDGRFMEIMRVDKP